MLETCVQVRLKSEMHNDGVMVAVDVRVDTVEAFEDLSDKRWECFGERDACTVSQDLAGGKNDLRIWMNLPTRLGNMDSLSMLLCTQLMRCSTYSGADILVGRL